MVTRQLKLIEPVRLRAKVVHGFGRGSSELGFPTANLSIRWDASDLSALTSDEQAVLDFARKNDTGIYAALSCVEDGPDRGIYKVAMSMGWNPTFKDVKEKTIEPWILHTFSESFYDCQLRLLILAYVRPEVKFESFDDLIREIRADGDYCSEALDDPKLSKYMDEEFLRCVSSQPSREPQLEEGCQGCCLRRVLQSLPVAVAKEGSCTRVLLVQAEEAPSGGSLRTSGHVGRVAEELASLKEFRLDLVNAVGSQPAEIAAEVIRSHFPDAESSVISPAVLHEDKEMLEIATVLKKHRGGCVMLVMQETLNKAVLAYFLRLAGHTESAEVPQRSGCVNILDVYFDEGKPHPQRIAVHGLDLIASQSGL
mmetsp:Transcript_58850/g.137456  ORF Transcript_58850/g.137456 Transcript_58850/m.137456 type:complete len:368 (-) Transcript_58850:106-1209(-)